MNQDEYIKNRLDDQIRWYDGKSQWNQKKYKQLRVFEFVAAASIPFLTGYMTVNAPFISFTVGLLGLIIAAITGVVTLYKFQENWVEYRTTCESLKHEKHLFLTKVEPYDGDEPFPLFVQRVESLISKENTNWTQYMTRPTKNIKGDGVTS